MKNGPPELCSKPRCKNRRRWNKKRKAFDLRICHKHESQRKRAKNPIWKAWRQLKDHAKARGIPFTLKLGTFARFAKQSDYLNKTGLNGHCLTVDRINNLRGYTARNIQPLTRIKNSEKKARQDKIRHDAGMKWQENYK